MWCFYLYISVCLSVCFSLWTNKRVHKLFPAYWRACFAVNVAVTAVTPWHYGSLRTCIFVVFYLRRGVSSSKLLATCSRLLAGWTRGGRDFSACSTRQTIQKASDRHKYYYYMGLQCLYRWSIQRCQMTAAWTWYEYAAGKQWQKLEHSSPS